MDSFPLHKVKKIIDYWNELSLDPEAREKRVRKVGDAKAQEVLDSLMQGKIEAKADKEQKEAQNADPDTLRRFLGLGLNPEMLQPKTPHKKEN